jgi:hypothetical protein
MSRNLANLFNLTNQPSMEQDAALPAISKTLTFDGLGDFLEERQRIQRKLETLAETAPKTDFSDFSNHVFFDSALSKFNIAKNKILNNYPFNGNSEAHDLFMISGSYYENYVTENWPRSVGYAFCSGGSYISASDDTGKLYLAPSSSLYITARIAPALAGVTNNILSVLSGASAGQQYGYTLTTTDTIATFTIVSGGMQYMHQALFVTSSIAKRFATLGVIYDAGQQNISMYLDSSRKSVTTFNDATRIPTFGPAKVIIGQGYTGSLAEIRIMHTASELYHTKNFNRPITSEDFVKLNYRFNEGITGDTQLDRNVIDYSPSRLHAVFNGYTASSRRSGSTALSDPGDLILYPMHPDVAAFTGSQEQAAQIYDASNRGYIFRLLPEDLVLDDENSQGILSTFSLAMARYFDELKMYLDQFDNLRITNYQDVNESPDLMLPLMKRYFGWKVTDHFSDSEPLQFLFGEDVLTTGSLDVPLIEIKNQFWRRILNNLPYLYKTKGKRSNLDSFFNVLGINPNLINLKEYGSVYASSIDDEYISKEKPMSFLSLGVSGTIATPTLNLSGASGMTVEVVCQLFTGSSQTDVFSVVPALGTRFSLGAQASLTGVLGTVFCTPPTDSIANLPIFNGQFTHLSLTADRSGNLNIGIRQPSRGTLAYKLNHPLPSTSSFVFNSGTVASWGKGVLVGSTNGYFGQARVWNRILSDRDLDAHALDFENVADSQALVSGSGLMVHYALNDNLTSNMSGNLSLLDLSRNNRSGSVTGLLSNSNSYQTFLTDYSFLSPTFDLKWTQNKVRIRNQSKIPIADLANDTSQVTLEFNLTDALNEDIAKIFSTMDSMNNIIGAPINKYRDEYHDLEAYRSLYFDRLTDSLHFTRFFKLFRWFDKKLAISIKQLLPARTDFIGGEFVVESHMLERNKYQYRYPIFHSPKPMEDGVVKPATFGGKVQTTLSSRPMQGTTVRTAQEKKKVPTSLEFKGAIMPRFRNVKGPDHTFANDSPYVRYRSGDPDEIDFSNVDNYPHESAVYGMAYSNGVLTVLTSDSTGYWGYPLQHCIANSNVTGSYVASCQVSPMNLNIFLQDGDGNMFGDPVAVTLAPDVPQQIFVSGQLSPGQNAAAIWTGMPHDRAMTASSMTLSPLVTPAVSQYGISSTDSESVEFPEASVNYAKEGVRRIYERSLNAASGKIIDPTISNGFWSANGNVFGNIDSNNSEVHYHGIGQHIGLRLSAVVSNSPFFVLGPGTTTVPYVPSYMVADQNGVRKNSSFLGYTAQGSISTQKVGAVLSYSVSASVAVSGFNPNDFVVQYADGTTQWPSYVGFSKTVNLVRPYSTIAKIAGQPGWYKSTMYMNQNLATTFKLSDGISGLDATIAWRIYLNDTLVKYAFKDMQIDFYEPLNDAGVKYYSKLGNSQNNKILTNINPKVLRSAATEMPTASFLVDMKTTIMDENNINPYAAPILGKSGLIYSLDGDYTHWVVSADYGATIARTLDVPQIAGVPIANVPAARFCIDPVGERNVWWAYTDQSDPSYSSNSKLHFFKSSDGGVSITDYAQVNTGLGSENVQAACVYYDNGAYAITSDKLWRLTGAPTDVSPIYTLNFGNGYKLVVDPFTGNIFIISATFGVLRSTNGGLTFANIFSSSFANTSTADVTATPDGQVFVSTAVLTSSFQYQCRIFSSATGNSGTFSAGRAVYPALNSYQVQTFLAADSKGSVYYGIGDSSWKVVASNDKGVTWSPIIDRQLVATGGSFIESLQVSPSDLLLVTGFTYDPVTAYNGSFSIVGSLKSNKGTFGPTSLASAQSYVTGLVSGSVTRKYKLGNIAEFPHYGGLFQMKNLVLGTQNKGPIGIGDDKVVEIRHVGSVANVLWPDQSRLNAPVLGFGESSIGQSPGNLTTGFTYGTPFDCSGYDHVSLYCYALIRTPGTLDDVVIQIQRRPLLSVGFATDQAVEYATSGSITEARYRDILHTKAIEYGDMTNTQISYVIDVPLVNVREIRVGAKQKNGQDLPNQNFLVWGRFVDTKVET